MIKRRSTSPRAAPGRPALSGSFIRDALARLSAVKALTRRGVVRVSHASSLHTGRVPV